MPNFNPRSRPWLNKLSPFNRIIRGTLKRGEGNTWKSKSNQPRDRRYSIKSLFHLTMSLLIWDSRTRSSSESTKSLSALVRAVNMLWSQALNSSELSISLLSRLEVLWWLCSSYLSWTPFLRLPQRVIQAWTRSTVRTRKALRGTFLVTREPSAKNEVFLINIRQVFFSFN